MSSIISEGLRPAASEDSINLMEVCGTHTMSIAKAGIKQLLPSNVRLISGPGCPVCVTDQAELDAVLELSERPDVIIAGYGDMIRVPGSRRGDSLAYRMSKGARVEIVFSPVDAIEIAKNNPDKEVVFLGIGFETTAPGTAMAIRLAKEQNVRNFSVLCMLKRVEPVLRTLAADPEFNVQGLLCPGHVASIIGAEGFRFLSDELHIPAVISGFEPEDIIKSCAMLLLQIREGRSELENQYRRAVTDEGNTLALDIMNGILVPSDASFRGMGSIALGGFAIRDEYSSFDAKKKFSLVYEDVPAPAGCICGRVIQGKADPQDCPLFGKVCTPSDPVGPCMVSSEGSCAAMYKYGGDIK